jgi:hypothetical protein
VLLLARRRTGAAAQKPPPSPPEWAAGWSWTPPPPASPSVAGAGAVGASFAAADGVLDDIAIVEVVAAVGAVGTPSTAATPLDVGAVAVGPPTGAWEPGGAVSAAAAEGGGCATLGAEVEEAMTSKGWCRRFETGGSLSRRVSVPRAPAQMGRARGRARRGESEVAGDGRERGGNPAAFVFVPRPGRVRLQ